jgi:hypothetical protein
MAFKSVNPPVPTLKAQLVRESCSMVRHLMTDGRRVPPQVVQAADQFETALEQNQPIDIAALAATHERLSRLVAPAKPGTLYLLDDSFHQAGRESSLAPIRLVRQLVRVAVGCVLVFLVLSVAAVTEAHPEIQLVPWEIARIVMDRVFWLSAAGIGASFAMLFTLNDQILSRTYDPDETASYWVKFFLGLVAGFILVALVPIDHTAETGAEALTPPTIALLGGFSASAVYRILTRMVEALESIFTGGAREQVLASERAASTRAAEERVQGKMAVAAQLVDVQQRLAAGMTTDEAAAHLRTVVSTLLPAGDEAAPTPSAAPPAAPVDKVPALVVVSAPEEVVASVDTDDSEDESDSPARQTEESAAVVG